jgi:hypothetical protein
VTEFVDLHNDMYVWRRGNVHTMFLMGKPARKIPLGRTGHRLDYSGSGQTCGSSSCEHGNQTAGSIKCREFLYQLKFCFFFL